MKLGVMGAVYGNKSWKEACSLAKKAGLKAIEPGAGGFVGKNLCNPGEFLSDKNKLDEFKKVAEDAGLEISGLACHGNPLHPNSDIAKQHKKDLEEATQLAQKIGVGVITCFAGCPGSSDDDRNPNWITCPWPPYFEETLKWQWEEKVVPFWKEMSNTGKKYGVKFAFEMHPGDVVYNPEALLRLREEVGAGQIACNFDPSHLFWQQIDPIVAIKRVSELIVHVHAKDSKVDNSVVEYRGVNDPKHYGDIANRAWTFRTVGYGHSSEFWNEFVSILRLVGYDGVISIEHEDPLMSADEGLKKAIEFLRSVLLFEKPGEMWWA